MQCAICLDEMCAVKEALVVLPTCLHTFHARCSERFGSRIRKALSAAAHRGGPVPPVCCPLCRTPVTALKEGVELAPVFSAAAVDSSNLLRQAIAYTQRHGEDPTITDYTADDVVRCKNARCGHMPFIRARRECGVTAAAAWDTCPMCEPAPGPAFLRWGTVVAPTDPERLPRCDNCARPFEFRGGCSHMTCVCGYEFCLVCGGQDVGYLCEPGEPVHTIPFCERGGIEVAATCSRRFRCGRCLCPTRIRMEKEYVGRRESDGVLRGTAESELAGRCLLGGDAILQGYGPEKLSGAAPPQEVAQPRSVRTPSTWTVHGINRERRWQRRRPGAVVSSAAMYGNTDT